MVIDNNQICWPEMNKEHENSKKKTIFEGCKHCKG